MPYCDWIVLIKEFLKKQGLNETVIYGIRLKYNFPLTFLFLIGFSLKCDEFLSEKVFTTHKIFLC